jgi:hypothetical protein
MTLRLDLRSDRSTPLQSAQGGSPRRDTLKKLRCDDCCQTPRPCQGQTNRNLVPGRGAYRPAGHVNAGHRRGSYATPSAESRSPLRFQPRMARPRQARIRISCLPISLRKAICRPISKCLRDTLPAQFITQWLRRPAFQPRNTPKHDVFWLNAAVPTSPENALRDYSSGTLRSSSTPSVRLRPCNLGKRDGTCNRHLARRQKGIGRQCTRFRRDASSV